MDYRDFIPKCIEEKMHLWNLSDSLYRLLLKKLEDELQSREECDFRKVVAPIRALILPLAIEDPETMTTRDFVFWLDPWIRPGIFTVIECWDCSTPMATEISADDDHIKDIRPEILD